MSNGEKMSRRSFLKWFLAVVALLGVSLTALFRLLREPSRQPAGKGEQADSPAAPADSGTVRQPQNQSAASPAEPLLSFWILSDLHINADDPNPSKHLRQALEDLRDFDGKADLILFTGDLTDTGRERDYKELRKILNEHKLPPYYANTGNHDFYNIWINQNGQFSQSTMPNGKTDQQSREAFLQFFGMEKLYQEVRMNNYRILLLSQETYVQERPEVGEGAWYSDEQMDWFKRKMAEPAEGRPIFVMTHQPLPPIGTDGKSHQLIRAKEFREILKPYPNVFVFCGHRHQDFQGGTEHYVKETFHYFHNSSVGRVLNRNFQQADPTKAQGMYVQVYSDKVVVRGREFETRSWIDEANWTVPLTSATA